MLSSLDSRIRSFTLTEHAVSITFSKVVEPMDFKTTSGLDRNLRNLTYGNGERVVHLDLGKAVEIAETTGEVVGSFKRNNREC